MIVKSGKLLYTPPPPKEPVVIKGSTRAAAIVAAGTVADLATESWVFWILWAALGLGFEMFAVFMEKRRGALPLTRVVRDRLMRKHTIAKIGMLTFLTWLWVHFVFPLEW